MGILAVEDGGIFIFIFIFLLLFSILNFYFVVGRGWWRGEEFWVILIFYFYLLYSALNSMVFYYYG